MELSVEEALKQLLIDMKKMKEEVDGLKSGTKRNEPPNDRVKKAFEKKQIGRPVGSWEEKRKQYFEWICSGKITQPKEDTLTYYKINRDPSNNSYVLLE